MSYQIKLDVLEADIRRFVEKVQHNERAQTNSIGRPVSE